MFNLINIGERAGSGVPNIFNVWEDEGLKESRTKEILKGLSDYIEIIGSNRDRRYRKK